MDKLEDNDNDFTPYKIFIKNLKEFIVDYLILYHNIEDLDDKLEEQVYEYIFDNIEKFMAQILLIKNESSS